VKSILMRALVGMLLLAPSLVHAQTKITFGYLADPSHEAALWALRHGKVKSDKITIEATPLNISALIQATAARTYDVIETAAVAVPRARERGLDLRIVGTGLRYHASGEGSGSWVKKGSPIKTVADLKGKKLGVYSLGSAGITLVRIALADVHGLNVNVRGGDLEFLEMPAPALPAALTSGSIDAATLIHAQAFKAMQTGEFVPIVQTAGDLTKKFGVRMVSAVLACYGESSTPTRMAIRNSYAFCMPRPNTRKRIRTKFSPQSVRKPRPIRNSSKYGSRGSLNFRCC
jgi:NitT/TauT family transport system substrate-binding protein